MRVDEVRGVTGPMPRGEVLVAAESVVNPLQSLADALSPLMPAAPVAVDEVAIRQWVDEAVAAKSVPRDIRVVTDRGAVVVEGAHAQFAELLALVNEGAKNILLVGPAGTGKTTLAAALADGLGLQFGFISLSAGVTESHLFGRILPQADGAWRHVISLFIKIYTEGGVFLLDELDAADANVMVAVNAALANGHLVAPDGTVYHRHADCIIIGAANTWGRGADAAYVGRNALDAATLDRFVLATIRVDYDGELEERLTRGLEFEAARALIRWVGEVRASITSNRLRRVASTRLVVHAVRCIQAGGTLDDVKRRYLLDWSADERAKVGAA
jgi:cobaltochelatase CobS